MINRNTHFGTFRALTINSYNTAGDRTLTSHDDELNILVAEEVSRVSKTDEQNPNHPPGPAVEVLTTTVSNVLEWFEAEKLTKAVTMSSIGVEKKFLKEVKGRPLVAVTN